MNEKISVILPTFNRENAIRKSIESILAQTYKNWELIIVNDCSTDNTLSVIREYANNDSRIKIINNSTNQKLPKSLNIGFSNATGDFYTWTSDDNAYHYNAFETLLAAFQAHPDTDFIYSDFNMVNPEGNVIAHREEKEPDYIRYNNAVGACFLYRASLAKKIGDYDPELFLAEDYEYWIKAYLNGNLLHLKETLYDYEIHENSLTSTRQTEIAKMAFKAKSKHFDALLARCSSQQERNLFFTEMLNYLHDRNDYKLYRKQYYRIDKKFAFKDLTIRIKYKLKNTFGKK